MNGIYKMNQNELNQTEKNRKTELNFSEQNRTQLNWTELNKIESNQTKLRAVQFSQYININSPIFVDMNRINHLKKVQFLVNIFWTLKYFQGSWFKHNHNLS